MLIDRRDTPANPSHDGNRHGIADGLVARPIGTFLGGLALPSDQRMPIGETLQAFALERGEPADEHRVNLRGLVRDFRGNHMRVVREQREGRVAVRTDPKARPATQLLVTGCDLLIDGIGAARACESGPLRVPSPTMRTSLRTFCANPKGGRMPFSRAQTAGPDEVSRVGKTSDSPTPKPLLLEWASSQTYV